MKRIHLAYLAMLGPFLFACGPFVATVNGQAPTIDRVSPRVIPPGATTKVVIGGTLLADATALWTLGPLKSEPIKVEKQDGKEAAFNITAPADPACAVFPMRVLTPQGATAMFWLMVDDLPTVSEKADNKTVAKAQELSLPIAVQGTYETETYDYFRFHAKAGQRIAVDVYARRLGSTLDPLVRLLDVAGHELAYADDDESTGVDGRFTHRFVTEGDYILELRDVRYQGSAAAHYRLRIGDFPIVSVPYPLAAQAGTTATVVATASDGTPLEPLKVAVPAATANGQLPLAWRYAAGQGSGAATLQTTTQMEQVEIEPNDAAETATPIVLHGAINGRFERAKDRDAFQFTAKKGEMYRFVGRTRGLGTPVDLYLRLYGPDKKMIVESDDDKNEEGALDFTSPADGSYTLMVEDLVGHGGSAYVYRIEIEPSQPGFSLAIDDELFNVPQAGVFKTKVTANRRDYTGSISVRLKGIDGVTFANEIIPEAKDVTTVSITLPAQQKQGMITRAQLIGEATIAGKPFTATASTLPALRKLWPSVNSLPVALDGNVTIAVGAVFPDFFKLKTEQPVVAVLAQGVGQVVLPLTIERLNKFDDVVELSIVGLPAGFEAKPAPVVKGKAEATLTITGPLTAAIQEIPLSLVGAGVFQNQPKKLTLAPFALRVAPPVEATASGPALLTPGQKQTVVVKLTRHTAEKAPVKLTWAALPSGITVADVEAAADAKEVKFEFVTTPAAAPGNTYARLMASTTIGKRAMTFEVATVALQINVPTPAVAGATAAAATATKQP